MTPEEHKKYLAYAQLGYGSFIFLIMMFFLAFFGAFMLPEMSKMPNAPPVGLFIFMWLFMGLIYAAMSVPSIIAGYALLKNKKWARTAAIVGGVTAGMHFPIGTAVCVYTFWLLFSEPGKQIFDRPKFLPPAQQHWAASAHTQREAQYAPPPAPPDWR